MTTYLRYMRKSFLRDLADEKPIHTTLFLKETGHRAPILVVDATDMPDFEPGDRVRRALHGDMTGEVVGHPFQNAKSGSWRVPVYVCNEPNYRSWPCAECTKLPRETSVLLRVTIDDTVSAENVPCLVRGPGVKRVERVEDPDE